MNKDWKKNYRRYKQYFLNIYKIYQKRPDLKSYLEILLSIITISFFLIFALRPTVLTITSLFTQITDKEETISKMESKIQDLARAQTFFSQNEDDVDIIDSAIPVIPDPTTFVRQLEGLANNTNVRILGLTVGETILLGDKEKEKKSVQDLINLPTNAEGLVFSISITGNYQSLYNFVSQLEDFRRPIKVDAIGVSSAETQEGRVIVFVVGGRAVYLEK